MAAMIEKASEIFRLFSEDYRSYSQEEMSLQEYLLAFSIMAAIPRQAELPTATPNNQPITGSQVPI
jgi:hypothetical protein